ncbi:hypothetical protein VHEMI05617 [[Torrubiella] hemipterigena]|uniref:Glycosyl transferase 64 domain-containing protein n=1 Tax=[Torrubiella] hemipterigena TaxID=1531966 RepID=A0A0A1TJ64_9HYPO|nr:hypothetical protein VHEMI05617 [[Torrubiella] hemipterigena]
MDYKTQAIFLSDDDIYFRPADLEFAFQMWRLYGRKQLTGGMARCTSLAPDGTWKYTFCENKSSYNMIITNLAFSHVAILDAYNSDDPIAIEMRRYVDEQFNCEDIALNFIAAHVSGSGPLLVRGRQQYVDISPSVGISKDPRHMAKRHACVNHFVKTMGCMPLIEVEGRIEHGIKHNVWYTTFKDRLWG